jgi:hypothetical protein
MDNDELINALTFGDLQIVVRELQRDPSIINKKDQVCFVIRKNNESELDWMDSINDRCICYAI